jgi:predicted transcriptional regulator
MQSVVISRVDSTPDATTPPHRMEAAMGKNIKAGRLRRDMSVLTLANTTHLPVAQIEEYEAGAMRIPAAHLVRIIDVLDMRLSDVFDL